MSSDHKAAPEDTGYYRYEIIGDNTHQTDIHCTKKSSGAGGCR